MIVKTSIKLQPCPFCGGNAALERVARGSKMLYIACERCHITTPSQCSGEQLYNAVAGRIRTEADVISSLCLKWNCRVS